MIKDIKQVINKLVDMSQNGYLTVGYNNEIITLDFHFTEKLDLQDRNETFCLSYIDDSHAVPAQIIINKKEIMSAVYYETGEFEKLIFQPVIEIKLKDNSTLSFFEDVR